MIVDIIFTGHHQEYKISHKENTQEFSTLGASRSFFVMEAEDNA
jgi:hypothetical protein